MDHNYLNKKVLFNTIFSIILIISISFSFIDLFLNEFAPIISSKNKSIFSVNYENRRYYIENPQMGQLNAMINSTLKENARVGLITGDNDWDYIYFGKNFKRYVSYIDYNKIKNLTVSKILSNNDFDALVVNTQFYPELYKKLFTNQIFQFSGESLITQFKPLNDCNFLIKNQDLFINVFGDDPYFTNINDFNFKEFNSILITINLYSDKETLFQIYYKDKNEDYNEEKSKETKINIGQQLVYFVLDNSNNITNIRFDPTNIKNDIIIKEIDIFGIDRNLNYKIEGNFLLIYK